MSKIWIFVSQAILFGILALFGLVLGPLFYLGIMKDARGNPATDAGFYLTLIGTLMLLAFALATFQIQARRNPLLRLCREGIETVEIGSSSLDSVPFIPGLVRFVWLILSLQGFRKRILCIPWKAFQEAKVSGPPMARRLIIVASIEDDLSVNLPSNAFLAHEVVLMESAISTPLDEILNIIQTIAYSPANQNHLESWMN